MTDYSNARLTDTQQSVLLSIYAAPTPEAAYGATTGAENVETAKNALRAGSLINVDDAGKRAGVTDDGQKALVNNGLVDETGNLTDVGQEKLEQADQVKTDFTNESFKLLKTLI